MFLRTITLVLFLGVATPLLVAQDNETEDADKKDEKIEKVNPLFDRLVMPDRNLQRRHDQAERLIQAERYAEAGQLLGSILESSSDFLLPLPPNATTTTTSQTFGSEILRKIEELPEVGRNSYKLQFETLAQRLLTDAIERGSLEGIQIVAQNYFLTPAGIDATFLLGMAQFEQGATGSAMFTLRKLQRRGLNTDGLEPTLSLTLATCQLRLGMDDAAKETLEQFLKRFPRPAILLGGNEPWTPQDADELLEKLRKNWGTPRSLADWIERSGWLLSLGNAAQNPSTLTEKPLLELLWQIPTLTRADSNSEARLLQMMVRRSGNVYLPAGRPLVVDRRLILRGMYETTAVDIRTGKRLWRSADADYRVPMGVSTTFGNHWGMIYGGYMPASRFSLRILFWHDRISHGMSSDGKRLFTIEGLELLPYGQNSGFGGGARIQIGNKPVEDPRARSGNSIVARDVQTGQVLWRVGKYPLVQKILDQYAKELEEQNKPKNEASGEAARTPVAESAETITDEERFIGETWFLGPPLPLYGRLNVIGENAGVLRLFVLDARSGKVIRQQPLIQTPVPFESDYLRRYYGLTPSAANGILYCPTGLGMVIALDATTAAPLWCFSYLTPPKDDPDNRNNFRNVRFPYSYAATNDEFHNMFAQTGWQFPCLMIDGNRLLVAPPDVPALYCLDAVTGELLWQKDPEDNLKRLDALYVACIRNGKAYLVTPVSMLALSMETGESLWQYTLASVSPPPPQQPARASLRTRRVPATDRDDTASADTPPPLPNLLFPRGVVPSGLGVLNEERYFLPLSDGTVAIVDLDKGTFETVSPLPTFSGSSFPKEGSTVRHPTPLADDGSGRLGIPLTYTPSRNDTTLGNLVGIQGLLFSQAPLRLTCFDQFEPLKKKTENSLVDDSNDATALMQLGRIRRAEGNIAEAVSLFRRSLERKKSEQTTILLRDTLLEAIRANYVEWCNSAAELESLAELPEELGEMLLVLAQGAANTGRTTEFVDILKKSFQLEAARTIRIPIEDSVDTMLHRAFGTLIEQHLRNAKQSPLYPVLEQVAEELFHDLTRQDSDFVAANAPRLQPPWWETAGETSNFSPEIRNWRRFLEYFRALPIADKVRETLLDLYEKDGRFSAMESLLNPPVQWFPIGLNQPTIDVTPTGTEHSSLVKTRRLAELLEAQGNAADAFYYYRQLELFHADELDGPLTGKELFHQALTRPLLKQYYDQSAAATNWPDGVVEFPEDELLPTSPQNNERSNDKRRLEQMLRNIQQRDRNSVAQIPVPLLGSYEPFHSAYTYSLETNNDTTLICYDSWGAVRWRCDLSSFIPETYENNYFPDPYQYRGIGIQQMFLKACNHYLLFARQNVLIALDTFRVNEDGTPTVLWTKTLTAPLFARQVASAVRFYELNPRQIYAPWGMQQDGVSLGDSVHPLPNVVCYRNADLIYGVDPMTGETLWTRDVPSFQCTMLSDREYLFLFSGESNQVSAIDPASGRELATGIVPKGAFFTFESNLIGCSPQSNGTFQLFACDLRDVFKSQRERALLVATELSVDPSAPLPTITSHPIRDNLDANTIVRFANNQRFVATLPKQSMVLNIYDLKEKTDYFGPRQGGSGSRNGVKLTLRQQDLRQRDWDLDLELIEGNPLVVFIENPNFDGAQKSTTVNNQRVLQSRGNPNNVPCRPIGFATMMLYDRDGNKLWDETPIIENLFRLTQTPSALPVVLFAASITELPQRGGQTTFDIGLCGIDKKTGKIRFKKQVPQDTNQQNSMLQGFRVVADPKRYEILFISPFQTVPACFTDKEPPPPPPPPPSKKEVKPFNILDMLPFG